MGYTSFRISSCTLLAVYSLAFHGHMQYDRHLILSFHSDKYTYTYTYPKAERAVIQNTAVATLHAVQVIYTVCPSLQYLSLEHLTSAQTRQDILQTGPVQRDHRLGLSTSLTCSAGIGVRCSRRRVGGGGRFGGTIGGTVGGTVGGQRWGIGWTTSWPGWRR